ncbi:diaminopimelate epimerase [Sandarakinorhabdus sp.]|uniref:diaminopimelate epimerase n=1 Tax=Sandarakinorhabdus sp. TaxID=1916663 RepID=UPI00286E9B1D|nr:diaminopimelate epimerase [Sandarakinorhabdus sp.]
MHGLGNDFVVFDARNPDESGAPLDLTSAQVRGLSDRRTGIGCDQLIVVGRGQNSGAVSVRFWNCDGEEVAACGNGSRAVAVLVGDATRIETAGGLLSASPQPGGASIDMGKPRFGWEDVPLAFAMDTAKLPLGWEQLEGPGAVSVGNPHAVFFVADPFAVDLERLGPIIEQDAAFPSRVNVGVAAMTSRDQMVLRVWERGAGLTRACGTGAVAAVAVAQRRGLADAGVTVSLPGGDLAITRSDDGHLHMAGPATIAFVGEIDPELYR